MFHSKISQLNETWPMLLRGCSLSSFKGCDDVGSPLMTGKWQMSRLPSKKEKKEEEESGELQADQLHFNPR